MAKPELDAFLAKHHLGFHCRFVPLSQSRNADKAKSGKLHDLTLNWRVELVQYQPTKAAGTMERTILSFDYSTGIAYCPSYSGGRVTVDIDEGIRAEVETGRDHSKSFGGRLPSPSFSDLLYSLANDSDVDNYANFDDWAANLGFSPDSRSAEQIYSACRATSQTLRYHLGNAALEQLQEAAQDY